MNPETPTQADTQKKASGSTSPNSQPNVESPQKNGLLLLLALLLPPIGLIKAFSKLLGSASQNAKRQTMLGMSILAVSILGSVGYYAGYHALFAKQITSYSYTNLSAKQFNGSSIGDGFSFLLPAQFVQNPKLGSSAAEVNLEHIAPAKSPFQHSSILGILSASSSPGKGAISPDILTAYEYYMNKPATDTYKQYVASLSTFIKARTSNELDLKIAQAQNFSNSSVIVGVNGPVREGWQFDLSGTSLTDANYKVKGKFVFAVSAKGYYYLMILAKDTNWDANQNVWKQMLTSYKIDQEVRK